MLKQISFWALATSTMLVLPACSSEVRIERVVNGVCRASYLLGQLPSDASAPTLGGFCLEESPQRTETGEAFGVALVAGHTDGACVCDPAKAQRLPGPNESQAIAALAAEPIALENDWNCYCAIDRLQGSAEDACLSNPDQAPMVDGAGIHGYCVLEPAASPPAGDSDLLSSCGEGTVGMARFVGSSAQGTSYPLAAGHIVFVYGVSDCP